MATNNPIPVAHPIPVAYPVHVARGRERNAREETVLRGGATRHDLKSGETVQSLAMRYGVTAEAIRRANKLWSHDSLAARIYVIIPKANETGVDEYLPNYDSQAAGGLDKTSVDSLFSSCDAQIKATRSMLDGRLSSGGPLADQTNISTTSPAASAECNSADGSASCGAASSSGSDIPAPPTYESCFVAETNVDAVGPVDYSSNFASNQLPPLTETEKL